MVWDGNNLHCKYCLELRDLCEADSDLYKVQKKPETTDYTAKVNRS